MGLTQPVEGWAGTKKADPPPKQVAVSLALLLQAGTIFPCLQTGTEISAVSRSHVC